jgi:hypothetical protein
MPEAADGQFFFTAERNGKMPHVQPGLYLSSIRFRTCEEAQLAIYVCKTSYEYIYDERTGVPEDAWYAIETPRLPVRFIRIFSGAEGLHDLLLRYAFHDAAGCVHEKHMQLRYSRTKETADRDVTSVVPAHLINALGIPQFYKESGNCWFASMLWVLFANTEMRNFCAERFALMNASEVAEWAREAFHVPEKAQKIRAFLWNKNRIGDDITAPPREDGKNGGSELIKVANAYGIPLRVMKAEKAPGGLSANLEEMQSASEQDHLLLIRCQDLDHDRCVPLTKFFREGDAAYQLVGGLIGQRECGHQQGFANVKGDTWAVTDSDGHKMFVQKDGKWQRRANMSPMYFSLQGTEEEQFTSLFRYMIFITKYGKAYEKNCNFSLGVANEEVQRSTNIVCKDPSKHEMQSDTEPITSGGIPRRSATCTLTVDLMYRAIKNDGDDA